MFDIEMGCERSAEKAIALRTSWPPPSRTLPSTSVTLAPAALGDEFAEVAICAERPREDSRIIVSEFHCTEREMTEVTKDLGSLDGKC